MGAFTFFGCLFLDGKRGAQIYLSAPLPVGVLELAKLLVSRTRRLCLAKLSAPQKEAS